jgi:O-antigen/teichoic acid export membrane protein
MSVGSGWGKYLRSILWSWAGTGVSIVLGFFLPPFLIRRLGVEDMALWTIASVVVDYCWLVDFGFRSATLKLSAEFQARGSKDQSRTLLNTGLLYNLCAAAIVGVVVVGGAPWVARALSIEKPIFIPLLRIVGLSWSFGLIFNVFGSFLESWQQFGATSRAFLSSSLLRSAAIVVLVSMGYGLIEMGWALLGAAAFGWGMTYVAFRRAAPDLEIAPRHASWRMLREMLAYGIHAFVSQISMRTANTLPPMMIVRMIGEASVTYFMTPLRILEYSFDAMSRISSVSLPKTAELAAQGRREELLAMALAVNRYGLVLFLPVVLLLTIWGGEFFTVWINAEFSNRIAGFFPFVLFGYTLLAGQWNSVSILFGLGQHRFYSWCSVLECILLALGYWWLVPGYGLLGAAISSGAMLGLNRGLVPGWLLAGTLGLNPLRFLLGSYGRPFVSAVLAGLVLWPLKQWGWLPGRSWPGLIGAGVVAAALVFGIAWRVCVLPMHREKVIGAIRARFG